MVDAGFKGLCAPRHMALNDDSHLFTQVPLITGPFSMALARPPALNISQSQPINHWQWHTCFFSSSTVAARYQLMCMCHDRGYYAAPLLGTACGGNSLQLPQPLRSQSYYPTKSSHKRVIQHLSQ